MNTIVVGTDGSSTADKAVDRAIELARATDAKLHVVVAFTDAGLRATERDLAEASKVEGNGYVARDVIANHGKHAAKIARNRGVQAEAHSLNGSPADVLVRFAEDHNADLIVIGNRGMTGPRRLLGSVPNKVSHRAACSVLTVDTAAAVAG
ncbi:MAG TPA: universal stress protein [Baekduia sp.]|nr:universal stress protein [Baekduia sp.]